MEIIEAIQAEGGGWFGKGMFETGYVTEIFHAAAASVWNPTGEVMPSEYGKVSMAVRRPMGVVSVISPWNFPCILTRRAAFFSRWVAGNTIRAQAVGRRPSGSKRGAPSPPDRPYLRRPRCLPRSFEERAGSEGRVQRRSPCSPATYAAGGGRPELIEHPYVSRASLVSPALRPRSVARSRPKAGGRTLKKCLRRTSAARGPR